MMTEPEEVLPCTHPFPNLDDTVQSRGGSELNQGDPGSMSDSDTSADSEYNLSDSEAEVCK